MTPSSADGALLALLDRANDLKRLPRTGWLLAGVAPVESVADHAYGVALLSLLLADVVNQDWAAAGLDAPLDVGRCLQLALVHDLAESLLTDLPKVSTALLGADVKQAAEAKAMALLTGDLPQGEVYAVLWQEYDAAETPEARLVKDADKLEMVHQADCYATRGQTNLDSFWRGHHWSFAVSERLFSALQARRANG